METLKFKFKWIGPQGAETGTFSKKGHFDGQSLVLDGTSIPVAAIAELDNRGARMVLTVLGEGGSPQVTAFAVKKGSAPKLKASLGRARSAAWAKAHREALKAEGREREYHEVLCPNCQATLDLTGMPRTPQVSCRFCHVLCTLPGGADGLSFDDDAPPLHLERRYRLCDECDMYSTPRQFTIFYFYFLLVVYGFSQRQTWRCPACMRGDAWKMLFGNLLFVLGVPVALVQLYRSYFGGRAATLYPGLDAANIKVRQGRFREAIEDYQRILERRPVAAGVKYNIGMAFVREGDWAGAARMLEYALADCSNYSEAATALAHCYEELGETEKLAALRKQWGLEEATAEQAGA